MRHHVLSLVGDKMLKIEEKIVNQIEKLKGSSDPDKEKIIKALSDLLKPDHDELDELIEQGQLSYWLMEIEPPGGGKFSAEEMYGVETNNLHELETFKRLCRDSDFDSFFAGWTDGPTMVLTPYVAYNGKVYPAHKHKVDVP